jgi:lysophospholipase L1-like esterase
MMHNLKLKILLISCFLFLTRSASNAQVTAPLKWWNPAKENAVVDGQAWPKEVTHFYDRFPARAKGLVRKEVWSLSQDATGLKLKFRTNAKNITVRYAVREKRIAMDHFPATGLSGIDLYAINRDGSYAWANGKFKFGDTITYQFSNLDLNSEDYKDGRTYCLYLPLYNSPEWLEIGVPEQSSFIGVRPQKEKPIVVYGTSIAQGGCASRPGMAWTAILERDLGMPVMNFGFSGNGRLEKEVTALLTEIDARLFVLDCLPNLGASTDASSLEVQNKIIETVKTLREKHPNVPILLAEHSGFIENRMDAARRKGLVALNTASATALKKLQDLGFKQLYALTSKEINMGTDGTVDGTHPSDLGMYRYALAYQKIIKLILKDQ